jgi:hypothetical protein
VIYYTNHLKMFSTLSSPISILPSFTLSLSLVICNPNLTHGFP